MQLSCLHALSAMDDLLTPEFAPHYTLCYAQRQQSDRLAWCLFVCDDREPCWGDWDAVGWT